MAKSDSEHQEELKLEPVKEIEIETKDLVVSSKIWIFVIIGLLAYAIFMVLPDINERMVWIEKDLNSVLVQSERFKKSTRVFARDNKCATCHLSPDHLLHNLQSKYPSYSDIKAFMRIGHQRYYTVATPVPDEELMVVYRTLK
ncbi:MAG TPA: hypothetical protein EYF95_05070 [Flavobacteriales bacterium]|jgi:hypothetical protein|nr:hypothetical protein [Flavobacteriales bacterium]